MKLIWCLLVSGISSSASSSSNLDSNDIGTPLVRVEITPFELTVSPTLVSLTLSEESIILEGAEVAIQKYLATRQGVSFEYSALADIQEATLVVNDSTRRRIMKQAAFFTILRFKGGIATFRPTPELPSPSSQELNAWVQTALNDNLLKQLSDTELDYLNSTSYHSLLATTAPSFQPSSPPVPVLYGGVSSSESSTTTATNNTTGLVVGISLALVGVALVALFLLRQRRRRIMTTTSMEVVSTKEVDSAIELSEPQGSVLTDDHTNRSLDTMESSPASRDDSMSLDEWTLSTVAANHSPAMIILPTESFERDRQCLKKDMLHPDSSWPISQDYHIKNPTSKKASMRRMQRKSESTTHGTNLSGNLVATSKESTSPFLFESEGGKEIYLMSPFQSNQKTSHTVT